MRASVALSFALFVTSSSLIACGSSSGGSASPARPRFTTANLSAGMTARVLGHTTATAPAATSPAADTAVPSSESSGSSGAAKSSVADEIDVPHAQLGVQEPDGPDDQSGPNEGEEDAQAGQHGPNEDDAEGTIEEVDHADGSITIHEKDGTKKKYKLRKDSHDRETTRVRAD